MRRLHGPKDEAQRLAFRGVVVRRAIQITIFRPCNWLTGDLAVVGIEAFRRAARIVSQAFLDEIEITTLASRSSWRCAE
jgi:hypothetical protein